MYSVDEILEMMRKGASPDDLASTFTANLNAAMKVKDEEDRKTAKMDSANEVCEILNKFLHDYYADLGGITPVDLINFCDAIGETANLVRDFKTIIPTKKAKKNKSNDDFNMDALFNDWVKTLR